NQKLSARPEYDSTATPFDREQAGGSLGGPLVKERLFWFANLEHTWQNSLANATNPLFPQLNVRQNVPISIEYAGGRLDWVVNGTTRVFVNFLHDSNL